MSTTFIVFAIIVVVVTIIILLSYWRPVLLGGEWYQYKVTDKIHDMTYLMRTKKLQESSLLFERELDNGPIYEGSNKLIHIGGMLILTYYSFWWVILAWLGMYCLWLFATSAYHWYSGGWWLSCYDYNEEPTNWDKIGPSKALNTTLPTTDYGWQKWILYYVLFYLVFVFPQWSWWQTILMFILFIVIHVLLVKTITFLLAFSYKHF